MKPIRNEADHRAALAEIEALWNAEPGSPEHDQLEVLGLLVSNYEDQAYPIADSDPVEALKFWMEQREKTRSDLATLFHSAPRASEILSKKRRITIDMAWLLHTKWGLPAEALVRPYKIVGSRVIRSSGKPKKRASAKRERS